MIVIFYFLSAFILLKIGRFFLSENSARISVFLFLASQPFVSSLGSDLVPWPSAVVMPLVLGFAYLLLSGFAPQSLAIYSKYRLIGAGFLLPLIVLTRLQVGLILFLFVVLFFLFYKQLRPALFVSSGILGSSLLVLGSLNQLGWLKPALYDQFVFGATYLSADKSTFPKPFITFGLSCLFLLLFANLGSLIQLILNLSKFFVLMMTSLICILGISSGLFLHRYRKVSIAQTVDLLTRRFWISLLLATMILASLILARWLFRIFRGAGHLNSVNTYYLLLGMSVAFQFQMYPLFDQMHSWWGSPLTFLVLVIEIQKRVNKRNFENQEFNFAKKIALIIIAFTLILPWGQQVFGIKRGLPVEIGRYLYSNPISANMEIGLQKFFKKEIPTGSRILNLCDDSNIYFADGRYIPSSRFFVYWAEQMSHAPDILKSMKNSRPNFIVTCGLTHAPDLRIKQEAMQLLLVKKILGSQTPKAEFEERADKIWRIYKNS